MNSRSRRAQPILVKLVAIAYGLAAAPGICQINSSDHISKEEYEVVSIALGKRTERMFMDGQTRTGSFTLRDAISAHSPTQTRQQADPALIRPRREPTEDMKRWFREERVRRQDEDAFKAEISNETVNDWTEQNAKSYEWGEGFDLAAPTVLLTRKLDEELPRDPVDYWNQLRTKYPDLFAIEEASRVGFNQSQTQAVVLVGYHTGLVGGEGQFILLEKKNGCWEIRHRLRAWLS
jgi:hypothetical protein